MSDQLSDAIEEELRALEGGWCSSGVRCDLCAHEWVAVWPVEVEPEDLQCPHCGQQGHSLLIEWT